MNMLSANFDISKERSLIDHIELADETLYDPYLHKGTFSPSPKDKSVCSGQSLKQWHLWQ
jgi:hypothetical protein